MSNSNTPLSSFASAATGLKSTMTTSSSSASNVKLSSAELLSMLKKPSGITTTTTPSTINSSNSNSLLNNTGAFSVTTESSIKSFKDDDYTLQGLINLIKACQSTDRNIFALGVDLENDVGLVMNQEEPLRESMLSPWYDESSTQSDSIGHDGRKTSTGLLGLEGSFVLNGQPNSLKSPSGSSALDSIIPSCYHVPSLPSPITKITSFSDETLFYIFYAMPGDRMQELAARELFSRGWRFYKPSKSWICPLDSASDQNTFFSTAYSNPTVFFIFDQSTWIKVKRSLTLQMDDLEISRPIHSGTASPISSPEIMHGSGTLHSTSVTH